MSYLEDKVRNIADCNELVIGYLGSERNRGALACTSKTCNAAVQLYQERVKPFMDVFYPWLLSDRVIKFEISEIKNIDLRKIVSDEMTLTELRTINVSKWAECVKVSNFILKLRPLIIENFFNFTSRYFQDARIPLDDLFPEDVLQSPWEINGPYDPKEIIQAERIIDRLALEELRLFALLHQRHNVFPLEDLMNLMVIHTKNGDYDLFISFMIHHLGQPALNLLKSHGIDFIKDYAFFNDKKDLLVKAREVKHKVILEIQSTEKMDKALRELFR